MDRSVRTLPAPPLGLSLFCPLEGVWEHDMQGFPLKRRPHSWCGCRKTRLLPLPPSLSKPELVEVGSRPRRQERHWQGGAVREEALPVL